MRIVYASLIGGVHSNPAKLVGIPSCSNMMPNRCIDKSTECVSVPVYSRRDSYLSNLTAAQEAHTRLLNYKDAWRRPDAQPLAVSFIMLKLPCIALKLIFD